MGTSLFSLVVMCLAAGLLWWHGQQQRLRRESAGGNQRAERFAASQYRRRVRASGLVGLAGVLIFATQFVYSPAALTICWLVLLVLVVAMFVIAWFDWLATRAFYRGEASELLAQSTALKAEVDHWRASRANGEHNPAESEGTTRRNGHRAEDEAGE